jgi:hypothetical protein
MKLVCVHAGPDSPFVVYRVYTSTPFIAEQWPRGVTGDGILLDDARVTWILWRQGGKYVAGRLRNLISHFVEIP